MTHKMKTKDYFDMLHHVPQRSTESRFARDYRAQNPEQPKRVSRVADVAIELLQAALLLSLAYGVWFVAAVLT